MRKHIGLFIGAFAAAVLVGGCFGAQPAKAEELDLIGVSDELASLYISTNNELEIVGEQFIETDIENIVTCTVDGQTQLVSQFAYLDNGTVNIRSGPSTDYDIVGRLYAGAVATAVDEKDGWTKIVSGNVEGYVLTEFLTFGQEGIDLAAKRNESYRRVLGIYVNLRSSASTDSSILYQLPGYTEVVYLGTTTNSIGQTWCKVNYSAGAFSYTGYVYAPYLSDGYYYAIDKSTIDQLADKSLVANIIWPLPTDYNIYSDYGMRLHPIYKIYKKHTGIDIGGAYGSTVVSVLDGYVSYVGYDSDSGNYVCVTHANGIVSKYLHLSKIYVYYGQSVKQGDAVGAVGQTGSATSPHLHFTMALNGTLVDPMDYLWRYEWSVKWNCTRN